MRGEPRGFLLHYPQWRQFVATIEEETTEFHLVGTTQGGDPARGRTPANGAAEGISTNAEPRDLGTRAVLPSSPKPPASRRQGAPEPSMSRQSEADLPASMTSQAREHRT